jgi:hypothetical protein
VKRVLAFGAASLLAGMALYLAAVGVALNYYDEGPRPAWLTSLQLLAVALVSAGLLALVSDAVRAFRSRR